MPMARIVAALFLVAMVGAGIALGLATGGAADALFLAVVAVGMFAAGAMAIRSLRQARDAEMAARRALATPDGELVARAVESERRRLTVEIDRRMRTVLTEIARAATEPGDDLGLTARRIHRLCREATADLRRQLGLLRERSELSPPTTEPLPPAARTLARADITLAAVTVMLAVTESIAYPVFASTSVELATVLATILAAATVLWWRVAPAPAAAAAGAIWVVASLASSPVQGGFWVILAFSPLVYSLVSRGRLWPELCSAGFMVFMVGVASYIADADNLAVNLTVMLVAAATGGVVRFSRWRTKAAASSQQHRDESLQPVLEQAVGAERAALARELHDTVSHAVGVIAVQAAAAEVSWPAHPDRARAALIIIASTATASLDDLEAVRAGEPVAGSLPDLLARFRAAGLDVHSSGDWNALAPDTELLLLRVVQESLTNVLRHSNGHRVEVAVKDGADGIWVEVRDDGRVVEPHLVAGFGLTGLRERIALAGGSFSAGPSPVGGFAVEAVVPVRDNA